MARALGASQLVHWDLLPSGNDDHGKVVQAHQREQRACMHAHSKQWTGMHGHRERTAQLAQVDLLPAGDDDVGEVVQAHPRGQVDGEVAHQQGQECVERRGCALAALILHTRMALLTCLSRETPL